MKRTLLFSVILASALCPAAVVDIPVVRSADVVVVGGSTAAVSAAIAAKEAGADVFLIAPRPYLGEDMAGTLRVVREPDDDASSPIYRSIFAAESRASWPFKYKTDVKANPRLHSDPKGVELGNGKIGEASHDSVEYADDVTATLDLGEVRAMAGVSLVTFVRFENAGKKNLVRAASGPDVGFLTSSMEISWSADGRKWSDPVQVETFRAEEERRTFTWNGEARARYVRVAAHKAPDYPRQLLAEIAVMRPASPGSALAERATPFTVKRVLDRAMLAAGVPYLTGSLVCDVLTDDDGRFAGVVMANRSGRQAVRAKTLIDATPRAHAARLAGGRTAPFPKGAYTFRRVVASGEEPKGPGVKSRAMSSAFPITTRNNLKPNFPSKFEARLWECAIEIPMEDGSARSFAAAEQIARDRTFTALEVDAANSLTLVAPPDSFRCRCHVESGASRGIGGSLNLDALRPKDAPGVWVLGSLADVSRSLAVALAKPGESMRLGARVGSAAAAESARAQFAKPTKSRASAASGARPLRVGEHRGGLPAYLVNASGSVRLDDAAPVIAECDTFVVGAGTGGAPAAIAAARHGAKTIVCDYLYVEGGVMTDGMIGRYYFGNRVGFTTEIDAGAREKGSVFPQAKSEWFRAEQRKAGAEVWFGVFVGGVVVEDGRLTGVVVVMEDGTRGLVVCKNAIDSTGNAELPAMAGEETEFLTDDDLSVQGVGLARHPLGSDYANSDIGFVDDTDAADVFYFALRSRLSLPDGTWDQAQVIDSRERRRMIGAFYMSAADVACSRTYPDIITRTYSNFDSHGQTRDDLFFIQDPGHKPMYVNLPYRCLLPKKLDGLLVTGLGISAHRDAMPILRMQPDIQNQGYAAGTAAAMAVKSGVKVRDIDVKSLQRHLAEKKILRPEDLSMKDNFPLSDETLDAAVAQLANEYRGLPEVFADRARTLPRLRGAFRAAEGEAKLIYAHVLAMFGNDDGAQQLLAKFKAMDWDKGWNYRGMGQFNRSVSWVDSYAIALGHCHATNAVPAIIEKAAQLNADSEFSHFRAVALALEELGDKRAVPVLADVLRRPGIGGRWKKMSAAPPVVPGYQNKAGDWERTLSLREICIARALFRLGDTPDGLGRRTLEAYAADPRRVYAKHARMVLDGASSSASNQHSKKGK